MSEGGGVGSALSLLLWEGLVGEEGSALEESAVIAESNETSCSEDTSKSGCYGRLKGCQASQLQYEPAQDVVNQ